MNAALQSIFRRRSVRVYENRSVPDNLIHDLLEAAMAAPSAVAKDPWHFIVVREQKTRDALANGQVLAPAKDIAQMEHVIFNAYTNATLTALFLFVVFSILFYALKVGVAAWGNKERTDKEAPFQAVPDA